MVIKYYKEKYSAWKVNIYQTGALFFTHVFIITLGFMAKSFQTRALGPETFGLFAFFGSMTGFTSIFFGFGFFSTIQILLAQNTHTLNDRVLIGTGFAVALVLGVFYAIFLLSISFFIDNVFNFNFGADLRKVSPLCFVVPFQFLIPAISTGSNKIKNNVLFKLLSKILFFIPLVVLFFSNSLNLITLISLQLSAFILASAYIFFRFKPSFNGIFNQFQYVWKKNKEFGLYIYLGQISTNSSQQLDGIFISGFVNTTQLGFYSLAKKLCSPLILFSRAFAQATFKKLSRKNTIPKKILIFNALILIGFIFVLFVFDDFIVSSLFGNDYFTLTNFILPLSIAGLIQGSYQLPMAFLSVKGQGKYMRNNSLIMFFTNLAGNIILIPTFGALGAAWACVIGNFAYFLPCLYYYHKVRKN